MLIAFSRKTDLKIAGTLRSDSGLQDQLQGASVDELVVADPQAFRGAYR